MKHRESNYVKQTQKDYNLSFKLQVVQKIEQRLSTRTQALDKYRIQSRSTIRTWLKNMVNLITILVKSIHVKDT